jgi:cytochrome c-type biogenesis protein CcmF
VAVLTAILIPLLQLAPWRVWTQGMSFRQLASSATMWTDTSHSYALMAFGLSALVIATVVLEFYRGGRVLQGKLGTNLFGGMYWLTRRNTQRYGGYIIHLGVVVILVGLAGAAFNQDKEQEMGLGEKLKVGSYELVGQKYTDDDVANYQSQSAILDVYKNGKFVRTMYPELREYKASQQPDHVVAIRSTLQEDLYVVYEGKNPDTDRPIIKAFVNPLVSWIWIGLLVVVFGTGVALVPNAAQLKSPVATAALAQREPGHPALGTVGATK